jgi:beta-N-acetylhexosaminidase
MTDDLNMEALSGTLASRTAAAIAAGCDMALHCKGDLAQMQEVAAAAGAPTAAARRRAEAALAARRAAPVVDVAALEDRLRAAGGQIA